MHGVYSKLGHEYDLMQEEKEEEEGEKKEKGRKKSQSLGPKLSSPHFCILPSLS